MAIYRWRGTTNTAWETSGNWVNESGTVYSSGYPGSGNDYEDDVLLDAAVTNGLAAYDATSKGVLRSLRVSDAYNVVVGTVSGAAAIKIKCQEAIIDATLATAVYVTGVTSGGWTDGITKLTVLDGTAVHLDGVIQTLVALKGTIDLGAACTIGTALTIGYTSSKTADVALTIPSTVDALPSIVNASGGTTICSVAITTLNLTDGVWTQSAGDLTTVNMQSGTLNWNAGNIATLNLYGGSVATSGGTSSRRIGTANVYPTAQFSLNNGQDNIQVTNYVAHYGGSVSYSPGYLQAPYATKAYAGTGDAKLGISPQVVNNTNVDGDVIYLNAYDRLDIYTTVGALPAGAAITYLAKESATSGGSYSNIATKTTTFADTADNTTKLITVWGYELTAGKPWVKVNVANSHASDALVACLMVKHTF